MCRNNLGIQVLYLFIHYMLCLLVYFQSHRNCCVPHCTRYGYHYVEGHGNISYFKFPTDPKLRKLWIVKIQRDEDETFTIKDHTFVCSQHFLSDDYDFSQFSGRRYLHSGAFPSIFKCWDSIGRGDLAKEGKARKANRLQLSRTVAAVTAESSHSNVSKKVAESEVVEKVESDQYLHSSGDDTDNEVVPNDKLAEAELQCRIMQERINSLTKKLDYAHLELKQCEFAVDNVKPTDIVFFTGFSSIDVFNALLEFFNPGENGENVNMTNHDGQSSETYTLHPPMVSPVTPSKRGRPRKLTPINQFFLYLCRVRLGLLEVDFSCRFRISVGSVSNIVITWANFVYLRLGSLNIWPTKEQVLNSMPRTFCQKYPTTRVIIDACEIKLEMPSSLVLKSQSYSNYKSSNTLKGPIGISPAGNLSFVSQLYTGSISDRELTVRSGILKLPFEQGDSLMADKGFDIQELLDPIGVRLNIPPFLGRQDQMPADDVTSTQSIAAERIHVERLINKVKNFHIKII